jgi:hypothetical protein
LIFVLICRWFSVGRDLFLIAVEACQVKKFFFIITAAFQIGLSQTSTIVLAKSPQSSIMPSYCSVESFDRFFEEFASRQHLYQYDSLGRNLFVWPNLEIRNYQFPHEIQRTISKQNYRTFHIRLREKIWGYINEDATDLQPQANPVLSDRVRLDLNTRFTSKNILTTRLWSNTPIKVDRKRVDDRTFRVDYQKLVYEKPDNKLVPMGNPGTYIFEHRNGCWYLMQDLRPDTLN